MLRKGSRLLALKIPLEAVHICDGSGYIKEFPGEKCLRDSRLCDIGGRSSEIKKLVTARELMKEI